MLLGAVLAVAAFVVITPGVDMALVTRNALMYGRGAALMTAVGVNVGIFFWVTAAALGLAAIVATSAAAFAVIMTKSAARLKGCATYNDSREKSAKRSSVMPLAFSGRASLVESQVGDARRALATRTHR